MFNISAPFPMAVLSSPEVRLESALIPTPVLYSALLRRNDYDPNIIIILLRLTTFVKTVCSQNKSGSKK